MAYDAKVVEIMIASPGEVSDERRIPIDRCEAVLSVFRIRRRVDRLERG